MRNTDLDAWAHHLGAHLGTHIQSERESLDAYQDLESRTDGTLVGYLIAMIIQDERNHHRLLSDMRDALMSGFLEPSPNPLTHELEDDETQATLREITERMLSVERHDLKELREMRSDLSSVADTKPWVALVDVMEADTQKHIKLLSFILEQL